MHSNNILKTLLATPLLVGALACGSNASFSSGVDGTKKASELSDADVTAFCDAAKATALDFAKDNKAGFCKLSGSLAGALGAIGGDGTAACEMTVTACEAADATAGASTCTPKIDNCDATIAEIEACYNDSMDALSKTLDEFGSQSCSDLLTKTSSGAAGGDTTPQSCKDLATKCPSAAAQVGIPSLGG